MHKPAILKRAWIIPVLLLLLAAGYSVVCNYSIDKEPEDIGACMLRLTSLQGGDHSLTGKVKCAAWEAEDAGQMEIDHPEHAHRRMLRSCQKKSGYLLDYITEGLQQRVTERVFARLFKQQILEQFLLPFWYHILFRFTPF